MTRHFLETLFSTCSGGVVELRAYPAGTRTWAALGEWRSLGPFVTEQVRAGQNVALGIATRQNTTSGTSSNLRELPAIFADIDRPPDKACQRLECFPFRPSYVVDSGQHVHCYWLLKEPADLSQSSERATAISVLRRLSAHLHGDTGATDLSRVLRLPGSLSFKYAEPRPVRVLDEQPTATNLSELDDFLPREVAFQNRLVSEACVTEGRRNDTLYALTRSLRYRGLPLRVIVRAIEVINVEWCRPPLDATELARLFKYAFVQANRPDFVARHVADDLVHDAPAICTGTYPYPEPVPVSLRSCSPSTTRNGTDGTERSVPVPGTETVLVRTQIQVRTGARSGRDPPG